MQLTKTTSTLCLYSTLGLSTTSHCTSPTSLPHSTSVVCHCSVLFIVRIKGSTTCSHLELFSSFLPLSSPITSRNKMSCSTLCISYLLLVVVLLALQVKADPNLHIKSIARDAVPKCSMNYCTMNGSKQRCEFKTKRKTRIISCFRFSLKKRSRKQCSFACILICNPPDSQPTASDGRKYCSVCQLKSFSCGVRYRVYGPVSPVPVPVPCSVGFCATTGPSGRCTSMDKQINCGKWALTDEKKAACAFFCPQFCPGGPTDQNGKFYCSGCIFLSASCSQDFKVYSPSMGSGTPATSI